MKKILLGLLTILVLLGSIGMYINHKRANEPVAIDEIEPETTVDESEPVDRNWQMDLGLDGKFGGDHRILSDGFAAIREARTEDEARTAVGALIEEIKVSPYVLRGYVRIFLDRDVTAESLYEAREDGAVWSTPLAVDLVDELKLYFDSVDIRPELAPTTGYTNTGLSADGTVVENSRPGLSGDLTAVKITDDRKPEGERAVYILARCSNPAVPKPNPEVPKGPTDEPEPKSPEPAKPRSTPKPKQTTEPEPDGGESKKKLESKSDDLVDYGAIQNAPTAPATEKTPPPTEAPTVSGESHITDDDDDPAPNLTAPGALDTADVGSSVPDAVGGKSSVYIPNSDDTNSPGTSTKTVVNDVSGDVNKDVTNNVGDTSIPVAAPANLPDAVQPSELNASAINEDGAVTGTVAID